MPLLTQLKHSQTTSISQPQFPLSCPTPLLCIFSISNTSLVELVSLFPGFQERLDRAPGSHSGPARFPDCVSGIPTCKHSRAVGVADVGVRGVDILREEDEDSQHHETGGAGPRRRRRVHSGAKSTCLAGCRLPGAVLKRNRLLQAAQVG